MAFRDDNEALRAKADMLVKDAAEAERNLEDAQRELARHEAKDKTDEAEIAHLRGKLAELQKQVGGPQSRGVDQKSGLASVLLAVTVTFVVAVVIVLTWLLA